MPTKPFAGFGSDIVPTDELRSSEYFSDYVTRRGTRHTIGGQVDTRGQVLIGISRDAGMGAFQVPDLRRVQMLLPHLWRALQLQKALLPRTTAATAGLAALHALPIGIILVNAAMQVIFVNSAREKLTSSPQAGLRMVRTGAGQISNTSILTASHTEDARALRILVAATAAHGSGGALRLRIPVAAVPNNDNDAKAQLMAVLVSAVTLKMVSATPEHAPERLATGMALVIARDLALPSIPSSQLLGDLFNLSIGEIAVATALLGGATAETVARTRQVSPDTVRRQIQSVLRKTEATNLRDFERMAALLTLMQPARLEF